VNTIERKEKLKAQLKDKRYRDAFVSEHIDTGIPFQIRALRKQRELTQKKLSEITGMAQERISIAENPNYSRFNLKTLKRIASAFDVALIVRFVPFSELVNWELNLSSEALEAVSFEKDPYFQPPVLNIVGQGGIRIGVEGIIGHFNPQQTPKPVTFLDEYKAMHKKTEETQKEMESKLQREIAESQLQQVEGVR
jgi:transcriptional regulator with XRE-family HTH domain